MGDKSLPFASANVTSVAGEYSKLDFLTWFLVCTLLLLKGMSNPNKELVDVECGTESTIAALIFAPSLPLIFIWMLIPTKS